MKAQLQLGKVSSRKEALNTSRLLHCGLATVILNADEFCA